MSAFAAKDEQRILESLEDAIRLESMGFLEQALAKFIALYEECPLPDIAERIAFIRAGLDDQSSDVSSPPLVGSDMECPIILDESDGDDIQELYAWRPATSSDAKHYPHPPKAQAHLEPKPRAEMNDLGLQDVDKSRTDFEFSFDESKDIACLPDGFRLPMLIYKRLFPHQREGLKWMWEIHKNIDKCGGLLGDDMGLGKTVQIVSFLAGLHHSKLLKTAIVIVPVSLLEVWEETFKKW